MLSWLQEDPDAEAIGPAEPAEVGPSRPLQRHSLLGVTVAGARPETGRLIVTMTLPITVGMSAVAIGAAIAIGWGSRRRAASGND